MKRLRLPKYALALIAASGLGACSQQAATGQTLATSMPSISSKQLFDAIGVRTPTQIAALGKVATDAYFRGIINQTTDAVFQIDGKEFRGVHARLVAQEHLIDGLAASYPRLQDLWQAGIAVRPEALTYQLFASSLQTAGSAGSSKGQLGLNDPTMIDAVARFRSGNEGGYTQRPPFYSGPSSQYVTTYFNQPNNGREMIKDEVTSTGDVNSTEYKFQADGVLISSFVEKGAVVDCGDGSGVMTLPRQQITNANDINWHIDVNVPANNELPKANCGSKP